MSMQPSKGSRALKAWRQSKKLTQCALAERLNVGQGTIADLERGRREPSLVLAYRLMLKTKVPMHWWLL